MRGGAALSIAAVGLIGFPYAASAAAGSQEPWLYYVKHPGGATCAAAEIWRAHLDGLEAQRVLPRGLEPRGFDVSEDGQRIVWSLRGDLYVFDIRAGTTQVLVRTSGVSEQEPRFSPDGRTVAYIADERGAGGGPLRLVSAQGGRSQILLRRIVRSPSWSPSGSQIAYVDLDNTNFVRTITVRTRRVTYVIPNHFSALGFPYFAISGNVEWTKRGLLHSAQFNYDSDAGGTREGVPPTGAYLTQKPVVTKGRLLVRFRFDTANDDDPGFVGLTPDAKSLIVTTAGTGVRGGATLFTGPLGGPLSRVPIGRNVSTPRFARSSPGQSVEPPPPPGTPERLCGGQLS